MKSNFICRWFLIVVAITARPGAGQTENQSVTPPVVIGESTRTHIAGAYGWTSVEFHQADDAAPPPGASARWATPTSDNTLKARGDGRYARTIQQAVMSAINASDRVDMSSVQMAIEKTIPGNVARLPAGCFEMNKAIVISEGISLIGAGVAQTILYRPAPRSEGTSLSFVRVIGTSGQKNSRISGIAFVNVAYPGDTMLDTAIEIEGCDDFRVDNCYFQGFGSCGVWVGKDSQGVIDHCTFVDNYKPAIGNIGYGVGVMRDDVWNDEMQLGTAHATFVEDCTFVGCRHAIASNAGAHYVFRHNVVEEGVVSHAVDAHGPGYGSKRGTRCVEIYSNMIRNPRHSPGTGALGDRPTDVAILIRGGGGVILDNTFQNYLKPIESTLEFGTPEELKSAYPWQDQVHDLWIWNNRSENGLCLPDVNGFEKSREYIVLNRDYFTRAKPGYVPFAYPHPLTQQ